MYFGSHPGAYQLGGLFQCFRVCFFKEIAIVQTSLGIHLPRLVGHQSYFWSGTDVPLRSAGGNVRGGSDDFEGGFLVSLGLVDDVRNCRDGLRN